MILVRRALGEVLRRHRTRQGRTLRDVADAARVSLGYLSEIERGQKEPSSELLYSVCDALGVPLSAVLSETGEHVRETEHVRELEHAGGRPVAASGMLHTADPGRPAASRAAASLPAPSLDRRRAPGPVLTGRADHLRSRRVVLGRSGGPAAAGSVRQLASLPLRVPHTLPVTVPDPVVLLPVVDREPALGRTLHQPDGDRSRELAGAAA